MTKRLTSAFFLIILLASCASNDSNPVVYTPGVPDVPQTEEGPLSNDDPFIRQRIMADMLYEARLAYDDNRLMSPAGNNAYDGFRAVLDFAPDNVVALQGIKDIVIRYVALADEAIQSRQYDNAESLLSRAARIDQNEPAIADAHQRLEVARQIQMQVFALDEQGLSERSLELMAELGEIGQFIRDREATFLIYARTDEEGRWVYRIMREAVGGYRLRGDIAVDSNPSIQVVLPQS
jgi:hypothetical protein